MLGTGITHRSYESPNKGICTGFTVIQPTPILGQKCPAGIYVLNGAGELTGAHQINEWGYLETPIVLTNTVCVGKAYDAVTEWMMEKLPQIGTEREVVIPVVGECDDSVLHDPRIFPWDKKDLVSALDEALVVSQGNHPQEILQGNIGAGTGTIAFDLKGGIGVSSKNIQVQDSSYQLNVLVQTNFGTREQLLYFEKYLGPKLKQPLPIKHQEGSCLGVCMTNAPLDSKGLERIAKRMSLGLARTGSCAHHGSGEIFLAFTNHTNPPSSFEMSDEDWDKLFCATIETTQEAVYHSLLFSNTVKNKRATVYALSPEDLQPPLKLKSKFC